MRKSLVAALAVTAALSAAPAASAHDLTCSRSNFSHWPDLKRDTRLVADNKPRVECVQVRRNIVRIIGSAPGSRYTVKQTVAKVAEKTYGWENSPFYYYVRYIVTRPILGTHG